MGLAHIKQDEYKGTTWECKPKPAARRPAHAQDPLTPLLAGCYTSSCREYALLPHPKEYPMKRTEFRKPTAAKKPAPRKAGEWVPYLPAIITALTALVEVVLKHFHP